MRFHRGSDGWGRDSYNIPQYAVVGSSDCGMFSDSPAPSDKVQEELERFKSALAAQTGIKSRFGRPTQSGNLFMGKQWVVVSKDDFTKAALFALEWLAKHKRDTWYIHDADLKDMEVAL